MNKQILKASALAVAAAMLPVSGFAAIDDQGMQYVSASEGLNGSLRVDILLGTDDEANVPTTTKPELDEKVIVGGAENSLRLWVNGSSDLGGGLSSTYYWEMRNEDGAIETHSWDLGLSGPWGEAEFGRLAMTAFRLVPSASLAFERGTERESPGCDPCDNGLRYESPSINGFKFGVSGIVADDHGNDDAVDEYSFAVSYDSPIGLQVGAGYEVVKLLEGITLNITIGAPDSADDKVGWRFGARYGQDNWLVGYEYRTYDGFWAYSKSIGSSFAIDTNGASTVTIESNDKIHLQGADKPLTMLEDLSVVDWNKNAKYEVHAFGVQVKIDRITASANYSVESQGLKVGTFKSTEIDREVFAADMAYSLGSRSTMVIGWRSTETENLVKFDNDPPAGHPQNGISGGQIAINGPKESTEKSEVYLFYRVDF